MGKISIHKLSFYILIAVITIPVLIIGFFWINDEYSRFQMDVEHSKTMIINEKKMIIKDVVNQTCEYVYYMKGRTRVRLKESIESRVHEAHSVCIHLYDYYKDKKNIEEIRLMARESLRDIRFINGRGYYFAGNMQGVEQLFADKPELEGKNLFNMKGARGKYVIRDMIDIVTTRGEGFYQYYWTKPGYIGRGYPKLAFVKYVEPFKWFIGTGEYLDDFEKDIKNEILSRIAKIRFGTEDDGYIFVVSYDGVTLMNDVQRNLIGKNIWDMSDPDGVKVIQEERRAAEIQGGDFIYYKWRKPSLNRVVAKVSFVRGIPEWQWMIGAGTYLDEIEKSIDEKQSQLKRNVRDHVIRIIIILVSAGFLVLILSVVFSRKLKNEFNIFTSFFNKSAKSNTPVDIKKIFFKEFVDLAESVNQMIAERKVIQQELVKAKDRALEANTAKNYFLASVSHEIRTPMNAIMGMTDIVLQTKLNKEQKKYLTLVRESTDHLLGLINNILEFSKIEAQQTIINKKDFDLLDTLENIKTILATAASEKGLNLSLEIDPAVPRFIKSDQRLITQVLVNIVSNAIKFTHVGGVQIFVYKPEDQYRSAQFTLAFTISDTGIGIPEEKIDMIFESFQQVEQSFTRKYEGTGLGLAISRGLIQLMGGTISVESEVDRGSSFHFAIPVEEGATPDKPIETVQTLKKELITEPLDILLAEDNRVNAEVATIILKKKGHHVDVAVNGYEVLDMLRVKNYDLILMDIEMPELDGIEATRRIRKGDGGEEKKNIPIFAISAHVLEDVKEKCYEAGINDFLSKPVNVKVLQKKVTEAKMFVEH